LDGGEISLHKFAREGNIKMLQELLQQVQGRKDVFVNSPDAEGLTALHYASRYNHLEAVKLLVEDGEADATIGDSSKATPLHFASRYRRQKNPSKARKGSPGTSSGSGATTPTSNHRIHEEEIAPSESNSVILYLVSKGADVNSKDAFLCTPLHYASMCGNEVATEQLLMVSNVDLEVTDRENMRPLHHACSHGHFRVVQMFLEKSADLLSRDNAGCLPIHTVCANGKLKVLNLIIESAQKREDSSSLLHTLLHEKDSQKNTALHIAVKNIFVEGVPVLIKYGADVNDANALGVRPLHLAAFSGKVEMAKFLVTNRCLVDCADVSSQTPLHWAAMRNQLEVIDYLVSNGADVEKRDCHSQTPLLLAAASGKSEAIQKLRKLGASILATQKANKSALFLAAEHNFPETALTILRKCDGGFLLEMPDCYSNTPLHMACLKGHLKVVKILMQANAKVSAKNEVVRTPLHCAAKNGHTEVITLLINQRTGLQHLNDEDEQSNTALHLASMGGHATACLALLEAGADVDVRNNKRWTALDSAAVKGHLAVAETLLQNGSPVDPVDKSKHTPLYLACQHGHHDLVKLFLSKKASLSILTVGDPKDPTTGCNPLDAAIDNSHKECARAIIGSDMWDVALKNQTRTIKGNITTPLRRLISKMPDVAKEAMDRCMKTNGMPLEHPSYSVTFDYEFLDDTYAHWGHIAVEEAQQADQIDQQRDVILLTTNNKSGPEKHYTPGTSAPKVDIYDEDLTISKHAVPYTTDTTFQCLNHPLMIMVRSRREELLNHPVAVSLLTFKWCSYGRIVYYFNLLQYITFLMFLTTYIIRNDPPFKYLRDDGSINMSEPLCPQVDRKYLEHPKTLSIVKYGVMGMAGIAIIKEVFQLLKAKHRYFGFENTLEWVIYILSILTVADLSSCQREKSVREPWQWEVGALSIFMSWMNLVLFLRKVPTFGIFVVMFTDVLKTFLSFFVVFAFFLLAFAFGFYALLENHRPFQSFPQALVKTWIMMTGELEYQSLFFPDDETKESTVHYRGMTYLLFTCFIVVMCVIIMNLLVGLAVDDIKAVQENAALQRLGMLVELGLGVEGMLPHWLRRKFILRSRTVTPYAPKSLLKKIFNIKIFAEDDESHLLEYMAADKSEFEKLQESHDDIHCQVTSIESRLDRMEQMNKQILTFLRTKVAPLKEPKRVQKIDEEEDIRGASPARSTTSLTGSIETDM
jgi:transient receptor potential cation channel subfamily A member 1